jgi:hypothetical protein
VLGKVLGNMAVARRPGKRQQGGASEGRGSAVNHDWDGGSCITESHRRVTT